MLITDPRSVPSNVEARRSAALLHDARDVTFIDLMTRCALFACLGVALFFSGSWLKYLAPLYWVLLIGLLLDRFTLMLHCTSHRQLFQPRYRTLNHIIPWVLGPFYGQTPGTYFAHHMGMHHPEENLPDDLSSTMRFRRDRVFDFMRYWLRFLVVGLPELIRYFAVRGQKKLARRVIVGELSYWTAMLLLALVNPWATLVVFIVPLLVIRTLMMMGNWAQHSFVCAEHPEDPYRASITCINTRYNRRCFNDGYHVLHHVQPRCHWTEHPIEFERALPEYGRRDAIVFDGIDYFGVWLCLMTGRWSALAQHFVQLPEAPLRTREEVIAFLQQRVLPARSRIVSPQQLADAS
jgi:fatty acid desaturase